MMEQGHSKESLPYCRSDIFVIRRSDEIGPTGVVLGRIDQEDAVMTSLLLGPQEISRSSTRASEIAQAAGHLDRVTETIEMDSSQLLAIAGELVHRAQQWPGMREPTRRVWELIAACQAFEAWIIGWPPGGAIELHDHGGSSGAVIVAAGELVEMAVTEDRRGALSTTSTVLPASASVTFGTDHVHEIVNLGPGPAISVHVYAPRLTAMTYYNFSNGLPEARATVRYQLGTAIP
jgi:predicted metal-dependent enzyme (double-stranded beta helix superfamily)